MLPAPPKTLGRLGDVLISALGAVQGQANLLSIPKKRSILVIMVDGLGYQNLQNAGGHAAFLNASSKEKISSFFPATTAVSIASFATATKPWDSGFLGYQIYNQREHRTLNLLTGWKYWAEGETFQILPTVAELARDAGIEFNVISQSAYENTGFTAATMRGGNYLGVNLITDRFTKAREIMNNGKSSVNYLYVPILDQIAHQFGVESKNWLDALEEFDSLVREFVANVPKECAVLLTADHGVVDVPHSAHIYIDEVFPAELFNSVAGDTRGLFLYLKDKKDISSCRELLIENYSDSCYICTPEDLIAAGYWKKSEKLEWFAPDLLLIAKKQVALYHRSFAKPKSLKMIGHHGAITDQELSIPLFRFGI